MVFLLLILTLLFNSHNIFTLTFCPSMPPFLSLLRMCYRGQQGVMRSLATPLSNGFLMRELGEGRRKQREEHSGEAGWDISDSAYSADCMCMCVCVLGAHACAVQLTPCSISRPFCAPCSTLGKEEMTRLYPWMSSSHSHALPMGPGSGGKLEREGRRDVV